MRLKHLRFSSSKKKSGKFGTPLIQAAVSVLPQGFVMSVGHVSPTLLLTAVEDKYLFVPLELY